MGSLTRAEEKQIRLFQTQVRERLPHQVKEILLFGSKARGDAREESDIDLLVITRREDWQLAHEIRRIGYALDEEIGYRFSILVMSEERFRYLRENRFRFAQNVLSDAVVLQ